MESYMSSIGSRLQMLTTSDHASVVSMNLFVALLCACIVIGHLLEENRWMNESITALIIGLCTGVVILLISGGKSSHLLVFSEDLFFIYLLPPIIFNAGFQVKKKQFFRNFMTIMLFGAVGTLISCFIISVGAMQFFKKLDIGPLDIGDYLAIGAIFAATDSVLHTAGVLNQDETPLLYSLVFGEGVVNDATSVVLFNAIQSFDLTNINAAIAWDFARNFFYLFLASTLLGVVTGLISAYIIRRLYFGRHSTDREVALMMLMAYLSYMLAELFYLSGILTVFFCGIVMSHYTWHNVTESSRVTTKYVSSKFLSCMLFATLSFVAETFIFLYVGMDALDIEKWRFGDVTAVLKPPSLYWSSCLAFVLVSLFHSPGTSVAVKFDTTRSRHGWKSSICFPLSFLSNLAKKSPNEKISFKQQFTSAGHTHLRGNAIMITSTITVVLFSTVLFGLMTKPFIKILLPNPKHQSRSMAISSDPTTPKSFTIPLLGEGQDSLDDLGGHDIDHPSSIRALLTTPTHTVHHYWRQFDDAFMRPMFGGRGFVPFVPGSPTERNPPNQWH
ncbi:hypothetical protein NC651_012114 [Populus alba x Populus x berolinensis]|nr:hypothetical protein NC651_012114 [Populus alba x Populus x berolinensis]